LRHEACGSATFQLVRIGQSTAPSTEPKAQLPASAPDQKSQTQDYGLGIGAHGRQLGAVDILSDTHGVNFGPYLKSILEKVRENWYRLIPESAKIKKGKLAIEFAIKPDGSIAAIRLVATSGDASLDRAALLGISASNPFPALPSDFTGPYFALRFRFYYNPDKSDLDPPIDLARSGTKTKSGVTVTIAVPLPGDTDVPLGALKFVRAVVTGTGIEENTVEWSISGFGCPEKSLLRSCQANQRTGKLFPQ
jgi:TonB family protein